MSQTPPGSCTPRDSQARGPPLRSPVPNSRVGWQSACGPLPGIPSACGPHAARPRSGSSCGRRGRGGGGGLCESLPAALAVRRPPPASPALGIALCPCTLGKLRTTPQSAYGRRFPGSWAWPSLWLRLSGFLCSRFARPLTTLR